MKHYINMMAQYENDKDFIRFFKEVEIVAYRYGINVSYWDTDRWINKSMPEYIIHFGDKND